MADLAPEEMAAMQAQAGKDTSGGATKLAQGVAKGLVELQQMLGASPDVTEEDVAQMDQILMSFADLVEKKLGGQAPGQNAPPESEALSQVSADAGMNGQPVGPQMKN